MSKALVHRGETAIRDALKGLVTHVGVSTDATPFASSQDTLDPGGSGTNLVKAATLTDVDGATFDALIEINGDTEFTNQTIRTIAVMDGPTRRDILSRSVRTQGIGVQAGDFYRLGARVTVQDNS